MRNFKRYLSIVLVMTMLMTTVSCLGGVFTVGVSADDTPTWTDPTGQYTFPVGPISTDIPTGYATKQAYYDATYGTGTSTSTTAPNGTGGWIAMTGDCYEIKTVQEDILATGNATLTDGYVQPGDYIFTTITLESSANIYLGLSELYAPFDPAFFDYVKTVSGKDLSVSESNTDIATYAAKMNYDNANVKGTPQLFGTVTTNTSADLLTIPGIPTKTGLTTDQIGKMAWFTFVGDYVEGTNVFKMDSSTWFMGFLLKVKDDLANGTTGAIYFQPEVYKSASKTISYGTVLHSYNPNTILTSTVTLYKSGKTTAQFICEDYGAAFVIGTKDSGGDDPNAVDPGSWTDPTGQYAFPTGPISTDIPTGYATKQAYYDATYGTGTSTSTTAPNGTGGWIAMTGDCYEIKTVQEDILASGNATLSDGYVMPGDYIFTTITLESSANIYLGLSELYAPFDPAFFDYVKTVSGKDLSVSESNTDIATYAAKMNYDNANVKGTPQLFGTVTTNTSADLLTIPGIPTKTGLTTDQIGKMAWFTFVGDYVEGTNVFKMDSSTWFMGFLLKVKDDLANGTTGAIYFQPEVYKSATKTISYGTVLHSYNPNTILTSTVTLYKSGKTTAQFICEDYGCSFIIGTKKGSGGGGTTTGYTATFYDADNSTVFGTAQTNVTSVTAPTTAPTKSGYSFKGWATSVGGSAVTFPYTISANTNFYPVFEQDVVNYSLTILYKYSNNTTASATYTETKASGSTYSVASPSITGYTADKPTVSGTITADTTITVTYTVNTYDLTINYTYAVGGAVAATQYTAKVAYGASYSVTSPNVNGYTPNKAVVSGTMGTQAVTENVTYSAANYTVKITYTGAGSANPTVYNQSYAYGASYSVASPSVTGYTPDKATVSGTVTGNVEVTVTYTAGTYNAVFYANATGTEVYQSVPTVFGNNIVAPADPSKTGYNFTGWTPTVGKMNTEGASFRPVFTAKSYTVTYMMDASSEYTHSSVAFDAQFNAPTPDPTKTGYTFGGWATTADGTTAVSFPQTLTTEGKTFYAIWTTGSVNYTLNVYTMDTTGAYGNPATSTLAGATGASLNYTNYTVPAGFTLDSAKSTLTGTVAAEGTTVINVYLKRNTYTFKYTDNDGDHSSDVYYGTTLVVPTAAKKYGYNFSAWSNTIPETMPATNFATVAQYAKGTYTVTFTADDSTHASPSVEYQGSISKPADPTKTGYTFACWTLNGTDVTTWPQTLTTEGAEYVARFTAVTYHIYVKDGNSQIADLTGTIGTQIAAPTDPVWTDGGMRFDGYKDAQGATVTFPITLGASDVTVYVKWAAEDITLDFYNNEGEYIDTKTVAYDSDFSAAAPNPGSVTDKVFAGWFEMDGEGAADLTKPAPSKVASNSTKYFAYIAVFSDAQYTVNFYDEDKTTSLGSSTGAAGTALQGPATEPKKTGYDFAGWVDSQGKAAPTTYTADGVSYYATYTPHEYSVKYYVDGTLVNTQKVAYGSPIPAYTYTKTGYTVSSWDKTLGNMGAADVTVNATSTINSYTLTITYQGAGNATPSKKVKQVNYNTEYSVDSPAVTGYTPDIATVAGTMSDENVDVTVTYSVNQYDLIINYKGAGDDTPETYSAKVNYGDNYSVNSPTVVGYSANQATVSGKMGAENVTVDVTYTVQSFTITYNVDGKYFGEQTYNYKATVTALTVNDKTGYTFSGWDDVPTTMPATNVTVNGTFNKNSYKLTINYKGAGTATPAKYEADVPYGDTYSVASATIEGYDVSPATVSGTMADAAVTVDVTYTAKTFNAKFYVDGELYKTVPTAFGQVPTLPDQPNKTGWQFAGWSPEVTKMPAKDVSYTATFTEADGIKYTVVKYTMDVTGAYGQPAEVFNYARTGADIDVTNTQLDDGFYYDTTHAGFNATGKVAADGTTVLTVYIARAQYDLKFIYEGCDGVAVPTYFGAAISAPNADVKTGYTFTGWDTEVPAVMPSANSTYTAQYAVKNYTLTITYAGTATEDKPDDYVETINFGTAYSVDSPELVGYTADVATVSGTMPAENVNVTVNYTANSYTITYMANGSEYTKQTYTYKQTVTAPKDPEMEGNEFTRWSPAVPATMPANDLVLVAQFGTNNYSFTYVIDGVQNTADYAYGKTVPAIAKPTKAGFTFAGWVDSNNKAASWPATMPANDVVLTATWTRNTYKLTYKVDGVEYASKDVLFEGTIAPIDEPKKTGYTFQGWNPAEPETMPAKNVTLNAVFLIGTYNATFIVDGEETKVAVKYGVVPTAPKAEKTGYTFNGWYVSGDASKTIVNVGAMAAKDVSYTAKFTVNNYTLTFEANGGLYGTLESKQFIGAYNTPIDFPAEPKREGYKFLGYDLDYTNVPAGNMTFTAQWEQDMSYCRVQSVERVTTPYYQNGFATYTVVVKGEPVKIQLCPKGDTVAAWTFDRNTAKVLETANGSGVVSITDNGATGDDRIETWTVRASLPAQDYKVRAKVSLAADAWENVATSKDFVNTYDERPVAQDMIKSVSVSADPADANWNNTVIRGNNVIWTVETDPSVNMLQFVDANGNNTVAYSKTLTSVKCVEEEGKTTWTITMRMTYSDTTLTQVEQVYSFKYRCTGDATWVSSKKDSVKITVTKYDESEAVVSETTPSYSVVEASAIAGKKLAYTPITIVTTKDVSKIRLTVGEKTATYTTSSKNVTVTDNGDNETITWVIGYRFSAVGNYTVFIEVRGNAWTGEKSEVNVDIYATQAEADEINGIQ